MKIGEPIICFAHDWHGDPTSKTHIMRILSPENPVLWVNSIGMRRPTASGRDMRRIVQKLKKSMGGLVEVEPNIHVLSPLVLPLPGVPAADRINTTLLTRMLRKTCRRFGWRSPLLWSFLPNVNRLVGRLGERRVIYHCVDEYSAFDGVPRDALIRMERDLMSKADLVLTSSQQLCDERRPFNENSHFVSHGVDTEHFGRALDPGTAVPEAMQGIAGPVIGFFGLVAEWVDTDLLGELAARRPGWSFVIVGKSNVDVSALRARPNVHFLGQVPFETLPGYCRGFDVGLIPFRINPLTERANPLKMREYLSAGLPVVSTPLPEVRRYEGLVHLADGVDAFERAVEAALEERDPASVERRVAAMRAESWHARVEEMCALIAALDGAGPAGTSPPAATHATV